MSIHSVVVDDSLLSRELPELDEKSPWETDPFHFTTCKISATALLKMTLHAREGGDLEVCGIVVGTVVGKSFVVSDAFALPVTGTETRVNATSEADEYLISFLNSLRSSGKPEFACGWYHSHPGYHPYLSGIDVQSQKNYQKVQDPYVAIVIDPKHTVTEGHIDIGAFRTLPPKYTNDLKVGEDEESRTLKYGVHHKDYYPLDVTVFKSNLENAFLGAIKKHYWINTLSSLSYIENREFALSKLDWIDKKALPDLEKKLSQSLNTLSMKSVKSNEEKEVEKAAEKVDIQTQEFMNEQVINLFNFHVKENVFNLNQSNVEEFQRQELTRSGSLVSGFPSQYGDSLMKEGLVFEKAIIDIERK